MVQASPHTEQTAPLYPLLDEWAGELAILNRSRLTIRAYLNDLRQFLEWLGPNRDPLAIGPADVRKFAHAMTRAGLEVRSRARRTTAIREFYKYLVKTKRLPESPAEGVVPPRPHKSMPRPPARAGVQPKRAREAHAERILAWARSVVQH